MTRPQCFIIGTSWLDIMVANHFKALGRELVARGHRVVFLIDGCKVNEEDHDANPAIYTWPSPRPTNGRDFLFLHRLIRRYRPACLVANFGAVNVMAVVGRAAGVPVRVSWYHTVSQTIDLNTDLSSWQVRLLRQRKRLVYNLSTHLVAVSAAAAADLQGVYDIPAHKVSIWPLLLRDPQPEPLAPPPVRDPWRVLCVGGLLPAKGQDVLLRALPSLVARFPRLRVDFVGAGPKREAYEALARELGVAEWCCFVGAVPHSEVLARMAAAAVVVVPSRAEALAVVNVESLAMGTPVVGTHIGGIVEAVRHGVDGFLVPPDDPAALAQRIGQLLANPAARQAMGAAARQGFLERVELRANIGRHVSWYEQLVSGEGDYGRSTR
jgi:glycosyltransferase involved in cell wall biosynthesis